ncbi:MULTISPECIES: hypothetical protein [Brevundimonas]|uniref:hypothetical protein n=1 Tax=Brevundimonas TaxID=41275 RepID=UPI0025BE7F30|nr:MULTISPECIES: hypothetical protein [Brevundimonas]
MGKPEEIPRAIAAFTGLIAASIDESPEGLDELRLQSFETEDQIEILCGPERQSGARHVNLGRRAADQCVLVLETREGRLEHINAYDHPKGSMRVSTA